MRKPPALSILACCLTLAAVAAPCSTAVAAEPENLALGATAWASSEHSKLYQARFAIDNVVPASGSRGADQKAAWCVTKSRSGDRAEFSLRWPKPVEVAELVYWGRTAWMLTECWKDFEVYLDEDQEPSVRGTFKMVDGPQRISLPAGTARTIRLRFLNSYGGANPGASEIQVFSTSPTDAYLAQWLRPDDPLQKMPWVAGTDADALRDLIGRLEVAHGARYRQATEHLARLEALIRTPPQDSGPLTPDPSPTKGERRVEPAPSPTKGEGSKESLSDLERLEREVLLFDVDRLLVIKRHEIDATHVYTYHYEGFRPGGGLYVVRPHEPQSPPLELVATPEGEILDCDLSYDGQTVLFSWRRQETEGYHLWTIGVDGSGLRQLTDGPWHDYNACWLPDGDIAFLSTRQPQFAYCWHAPVGVLHRMRPDGSDLRRLSANYLNDFTPSVLDDGRIIYSRWEYVDRPAIPIQSVWTINPNGTDLAGYFGNRVISPGTFMDVRSIPGTTKIVCTMTGHNGPARGAIGIVDRTKGVNAQEAIENITPDVPVPRVDEGNGNFDGQKLYSNPNPLDGERLLVSARGPLLVRDFAGKCQAVVLETPEDGMQYFSARPVRPRARPPVIASKLEETGEATDDLATVVLQDVYNGLEPHVRRGEVKRIRVVREMQKAVRIDPKLRAFGFQFPVISCGATYAAKMVLGEVPVEADGSAAFRVPAGVPLYFMALDAEGRAVQRMRSFTHLMPGEVQGCVGCHESRLQSSRPRATLAAAKPPAELQAPEWGVAGFDYSRIVQPVLDRYCVECHRAGDAQGGVDLAGDKTDFFSVSYDVLAREHQGPRGSPFVSWIPTYNGQEQNILDIRPKAWGSYQSVLAEVVLSGHADEKGQARVAMDEASRRRVLAWIDLNVPYYGTSETAYPERVGCRQILPDDLDKTLADVTARRCAECHAQGKIPRREWVRITGPELNGFLLAPLARSAGGTEVCGRPVFQTTDDPDYRAILATFQPIQEMLRTRPRMDMPGAEPAPDVCRVCQ